MPLPSPDTLMRRAARHHLAGDLREAAALYRRVLQDRPQHAGALHALGVMAQQTGRMDAAEKLLLRAVATDPSLAAAHDDLGALWLIQGKTQQAAAAFGEAVRVDPKYARAHAHLGAALAAMGRHDEAAAAYQRAVDSAMTSVRRFKSVGIDVTSITQPLTMNLSSNAAVGGAAHGAYSDDDDDDPPAGGQPSEPVMTLVDDDDDEGVVGLTLVPPSVASPVALPPLAARAEEIGLAYATMAGVPASSPGYPWVADEVEARPAIADDDGVVVSVPFVGDEWAGALTLSVADPDAWLFQAPTEDASVLWPTTSDAEPVWNVDEPQVALLPPDVVDPAAAGMAFADDVDAFQPQVEVEVELNRFESRLSSFGGVATAAPLATSTFAAAAPPETPADTLINGSVDTASSVNLETADTTLPIADPLAPPPGEELPVAAAAVGVALAIEVASTVEIIPVEATPVTAIPVSVTTVASSWDVSSNVATFDIAAPTIVEVAPATSSPEEVADAGDFVPLEQERSAVDLPADESEEEREIDVLPADPVAAPPPVKKIALPKSASRLTEDPVLAPRMLAKELRRARRKPVAGAKQAAELHRQGTSHLRQRRVDEAIVALERLVELQPGSAKAHRDLGAAYIRGDRIDDAIASLQKALELRPRFGDALASLGDAYHLQGRVEEAINCYRQTLTLRPSAAGAHSNLLLNLNYQRKSEPASLFGEHLKWAKAHASPLAREILPHANDPTPTRPLRIGYVSPDFRRHAAGSFIEPILSQRDPESFHVIGYSDVLRPDDTTERISQLCDGWRDCRGLSDTELTEMIREDRVDILLDLAGHTGGNRLCVFARKPAPVQVTYLGYPNTTGLPTMDYRLTDGWADPLGQSEQHHSEQLYRLPRGFLCYMGPPEAPTPAAPPITKNGFVTFGCFNILAKLTPETLGLWAKVMTVLPKSRMVLKDRLGTFANPARRRWVQDIFAYHRITADRLDLLEKEPDRMKHLESYSKVDLMLDPFPYNGTTTTCEALWMGVPVITLTGNRHASRVGVSILKSAGLPEFIAANLEGYARSAVLMARDVNRLTLLRRTLRQKVAASSLCDAEKFTKILGMAYREMWTYWCQTRDTSPMLPGVTPKMLEG